MSGDTVLLFFDDHENRKAWRFLWGNETFYDDEDRLMTWNTVEQALDWYKEQEYEMKVVMEVADDEPEEEIEEDNQISMF